MFPVGQDCLDQLDQCEGQGRDGAKNPSKSEANLKQIILSRSEPSPPAVAIERESLVASLELARFQIERGNAWSATEIINETIREIRNEPMLQQ